MIDEVPQNATPFIRAWREQTPTQHSSIIAGDAEQTEYPYEKIYSHPVGRGSPRDFWL